MLISGLFCHDLSVFLFYISLIISKFPFLAGDMSGLPADFQSQLESLRELLGGVGNEAGGTSNAFGEYDSMKHLQCFVLLYWFVIVLVNITAPHKTTFYRHVQCWHYKTNCS